MTDIERVAKVGRAIEIGSALIDRIVEKEEDRDIRAFIIISMAESFREMFPGEYKSLTEEYRGIVAIAEDMYGHGEN